MLMAVVGSAINDVAMPISLSLLRIFPERANTLSYTWVWVMTSVNRSPQIFRNSSDRVAIFGFFAAVSRFTASQMAHQVTLSAYPGAMESSSSKEPFSRLTMPVMTSLTPSCSGPLM